MCAINTPSAVSMATAPNPRGVDGRRVNPTPVVGGAMAITPKNNDPKESKLCDFSYISMTNPPIPL